MIYSKGIEYVGQQLEGFLKETSEGGSGDDITLGIIRRIESGDWDDRDRNNKKLKKDMEQLTKKQQKTGKVVLGLVIGLVVTFPLAIISTVLSSWLFFFKLNDIDFKSEKQQQELNDLKLQIQQIKRRQQQNQ